MSFLGEGELDQKDGRGGKMRRRRGKVEPNAPKKKKEKGLAEKKEWRKKRKMLGQKCLSHTHTHTLRARMSPHLGSHRTHSIFR